METNALKNIFENEEEESDQPVTPFDIFHIPAIHPPVEAKMVELIMDNIRNHIGMTTFDVALIGVDYYYSIENLALKSAIISFIHSKKSYKKLNGEYNEALYALAQERMEYSPDDLMKKYCLKEFMFSNSWLSDFMMRHNLSLRKGHVERRGAIDQMQVQHFCKSLANAILTYGRSNIFNMDETFIRLRNFSQYVIAEKGQSEVRVMAEHSVNAKQGTTFLATICMDPERRVPLAFIAKGKTEKCEEKYGNIEKEDGIAFHSESGWTTAEVMIRYLDWLREQIQEEEIALVLDVYAAHRKDEVKEHAEKLKIHLIFVPACGTGYFQPLDRIVFGIVKGQLGKQAMLQRQNNFTDKDLYKQCFPRTKSVFDRISKEAIKSAWDIPYINQILDDSMECIDDDPKDQDYTDS